MGPEPLFGLIERQSMHFQQQSNDRQRRCVGCIHSIQTALCSVYIGNLDLLLPLDIAERAREAVYSAPEVAILGHTCRGIETRAQYLVQMPICATFEIPAREPCIRNSALTSQLCDQNATAGAFQRFSQRHVATREPPVQQLLDLSRGSESDRGAGTAIALASGKAQKSLFP